MPTPIDRLHEAQTWVFDLDNTLYPARCELFAQIDVKMMDFIARRFDIDPAAARVLQKELWQRHGTTLRGLMLDHGMEPGPFLDHVHDIDLAPVSSCAVLKAAIEMLPGRKLVFTNGTVAHAERVLDKLDLGHCFEGVYDIVAMDYLPKPDPAAYARFCARHDVDPTRAVMVEDLARNLVPAAALGMTTAWIAGANPWGLDDGVDHIHHVVEDLSIWLDGVVGPLRAVPAGAAAVRPD